MVQTRQPFVARRKKRRAQRHDVERYSTIFDRVDFKIKMPLRRVKKKKELDKEHNN